MKKRLTVIVVLTLIMALCTAIAACGGGNGGDNSDDGASQYGTLTIENVTMKEGEKVTITPVFSKESYKITYSFEGVVVAINGGVITANKAGVVTVTAKTNYHTVTFTVTVTAKDEYGTLAFDNIEVDVGSSTILKPKFSNPDKAEPVTYLFEGNDISIVSGKLTALVPGKTVTVTAKTEHHTATFTVTTKQPYVDYGRLIIPEIDPIKEGNSVKIFVQFSDNKYADDVTFTYDSDAITIDSKYNLTALKGGCEVEVTATTKYHEVKFTVTTLKDYGELVISNMYAWLGYPSPDFYPYFTMPENADEITYEYDQTAIDIDTTTRKITPIKTGVHTVKASTDKITTTFTVTVQEVDTTAEVYQPTATFTNKAKARLNQWSYEGIDNSTTIYIGDSFFDHAEFWQDFNMTHYAGKDALCLGISATKTYHWENWAKDGWLGQIKPKNVAVHIGTNNVSAGDSAENVTSSLQRLFTMLHEKSPSTKYYWFSITHRANVSNNHVRDAVNANMKAWCEGRGYVTYVHTVDQFPNTTLKDGTHLYLEYYKTFVDALDDSGAVIGDLPAERMGLEMSSVGLNKGNYDPATKTFTGTCDLANPNRLAAYMMKDGKFYNGNFMVTGTISFDRTTHPDLEGVQLNDGWAGLFVNDTPHNTWFGTAKAIPIGALLWGKQTAVEVRGYYADVNSAYTKFANYSNKTANFKVIAYDGTIVFDINGKSIYIEDKEAFTNTYFGIVAENADVTATFDFITDDEVIASEITSYDPSLIRDVAFDKTMTIGGAGRTGINYNGETLKRNFILTGKLTITDSDRTQSTTKPHIQLGHGVANDRFLIWDNGGNNQFKVGTPYTVTNSIIYKLETGKPIVIDWKVVVTADDVYYYLDGDLVAVYTNVASSDAFIIGSEWATCTFSDMQAISLVVDGDKYTEALAQYKSVTDVYGKETESKKIRVK